MSRRMPINQGLYTKGGIITERDRRGACKPLILAESAPGSTGTITRGIDSADASSQACRPPAPPNATAS